MTDDELDRALLALPLDEPPVGLRDRVLTATIYRPPTPALFRTWELWAIAAAVAIVGFMTFTLLGSLPDLGDRTSAVLVDTLRSLGLSSASTYAWLAVGASAVYTISSLPLMPAARRNVYNR